jgi:hypothetical protein
MGEAFLWGSVAGSSLVLGGLIALRFPISRRLLGLIMAFGAGVLISAVAFELVHEAFETSAGDGGVAFGLLAGSLVFFGAEVVIDRLGERERDDSGSAHAAHAGRALVLGIILDGIPESLVLGLTVLQAGTVSAAFLVAVFLSNLPEAIRLDCSRGSAHRRGRLLAPILQSGSTRLYVPTEPRRRRRLPSLTRDAMRRGSCGSGYWSHSASPSLLWRDTSSSMLRRRGPLRLSSHSRAAPS